MEALGRGKRRRLTTITVVLVALAVAILLAQVGPSISNHPALAITHENGPLRAIGAANEKDCTVYCGPVRDEAAPSSGEAAATDSPVVVVIPVRPAAGFPPPLNAAIPYGHQDVPPLPPPIPPAL
jgi:hypothetical protein